MKDKEIEPFTLKGKGFIDMVNKYANQISEWRETLEEIKNKRNNRESLEFLIQVMNNPKLDRKACDAAYHLGDFDFPEAISELYKVVCDVNRSYDLRTNAIEGLFNIASRNELVYNKLISILKSKFKGEINIEIVPIFIDKISYSEINKEFQNNVIELLIHATKDKKIKQEFLGDIISLFGDLKLTNQLPLVLELGQDESLAFYVKRAINEIGYKFILKQLESNENPIIRQRAAEELGFVRSKIGYNVKIKDWDITEEQAINSLRKALKDPDREVVISVLKAISYYGEFALSIIIDLEEFLKSEDKSIKIIAEKTVRRIISEDKEEAENLIKQLKEIKAKKEFFDFNRENLYLIFLIVSIVMNVSKIIVEFFLLNDNIKQIIGFIVLAFNVFIILFLLGASIYNCVISRKKKQKSTT